MTTHALPRGFGAFLLTQSFGAFNDNFYKMLLQLFVLVIARRPDAENVIAQATLVFTVPFVCFGPWSGYLADRFAKTRVMRVVKLIEIGIMALGVAAMALGAVPLMLVVVFCMATHSTFFSPAKAGYIPETCPPELITRANSFLSLTTFVAIILGTALAGILLASHGNRVVPVSLYCLAIAGCGAFAAFRIPTTRAAGATTAFPWNPLAGIAADLQFLYRQRGLFLASLAISYFWLLGLIFQTNILVYGTRHLGLTEHDNTWLSILPALIGIGIAVGSLLASRWSGKKVELGLTPLGGLGLTCCGIALYFTDFSYWYTATIVFASGVFGSLFIIPLTAYLQFTADEHEKGRVLATNGILNGLFLVCGSLLYRLLAIEMDFTPKQIYCVMGWATLGVTIYICTVIPEYLLRFVGWLLAHCFYRIRIAGEEHVPLHGPALVVSNHVSFIDALLIGATVQRFIKFIMYKRIYDYPLIRPICRLMEAIPIAPYEGRESVARSLTTARTRLHEGEIVCIFPEGAITRDAQVQEFKDGFEAIMEGMTCPIVPVYLHNVWGSIFSFEGGKVFWKWPKRIPYPVTVCYGAPLPAAATVSEVRAAVMALAEGVDR